MVRRVDDDFDPDGSTLSPASEADSTAGGAPTDGVVDRDEQLGEAIEAYLEQAEGGVPPDPETFAADYPDLGDDLLAALEGLALVKGLVGGPSGPGHRLEEGRRVAGYRIVRELGRGGMGVVYEAVHVGLDRPVALKVLGSQAAPDSSGRRRFLNEARTAAGLHHTHIVPVFDVGQVGGLCYYAMQRIEGSGLDRVLRVLRRDRTVASGSTQGSTLKPGKLAPNVAPVSPIATHPGHDGLSLSASGLGDETLSWAGDLGGGNGKGRWALDADREDGPVFAPPRGSSYYRWVADVGRQAAEALAHAHQRGIIHRDIKPSNLLVDARGVIWVADFGLARRLADPSQTQVDSLLGTPRYMSPEQAKTGAIDGRADVYSLGATLYELITLRPPFDGQTAAELIDQIATREPQRPRKFDPRVPLDLETILLKALAKRPSDRYAGATELADDLGRFLAHEPVRARRIGPIGRAWRFARRHPGASAVSALAASLVLTTATVAYVRVVRERDRADEYAKDERRAKEEAVASEGRYQISLLNSLEGEATNVLLSAAPKRRSRGLDVVRRANELGSQMKPDTALRGRLRDQAMAFLTLRDVEARPSIPTSAGPRLVFGPNGQRIAALTDDGELGIWDVAKHEAVDSSRMPIAPIVRRNRGGRGGGGGGGRGGYRPPVLGERIALAGDQCVVIQRDEAGLRWFDIASPDTPVDHFPIKGQQVVSVLATADGRRFLTVGQTPATARGPSGGPGAGLERGEPRAELEEPRICLWDRDHPEAPRATLSLGTAVLGGALMLAIAPDGSKIAAARWYGSEVALWDGDGRSLDPIQTQGNTTALALGPASALAVASNGGDVALWDLSLSLPKPLPSLDMHQSFINLLRFGPRDGSILAASGVGGGVELWDLATHTPIAALTTAESVEDLAFSADGRTLAAAQASSIAFWSLVEPTAQNVLPESGDQPWAMAFGPDDLLAIASRDIKNELAPLRLWGGPGQCPPSILSWPRHRPASVGFDALGRMVVPELDAIRWFQPPQVEPVAEVAISTDSRGGGRPGDGRGGNAFPPRIVARTADGSTLLLVRGGNNPANPLANLFKWQATTPDSMIRIEVNGIEGFGQGYSRGPTLAIAPGATRIYHLARRGDELAAREIDAKGVHPAAIWTVATSQASMISLSPDGTILAVGNHSGEVELRSASSGLVVGRLAVPEHDNSGAVESLAFAPDGRTLAVGGREQVRLWAVDGTPRSLVRLPGHRGLVRTLTFDLKGVRLAGADERTIKVWDLARLREEFGKLGLDW